jgi:hypothetical protein
LAFLEAASHRLEGDGVTRTEIVRWMAAEPDPRAALDALFEAVKVKIAEEAL